MLTSEESKFYFDADCYSHRLAVLLGRFELPGTHSFQRLLVESQAQAALHFQTARTPGSIDDQSQNHSPLILSLAGFFRILRIGLVDRAGRGYAANARTEDSAAVSTAGTRTNTASDPGADSTATSRADSSSATYAVRRRSRDHRGFWVAKVRQVTVWQLHLRGHYHRRLGRYLGMIIQNYNF